MPVNNVKYTYSFASAQKKIASFAEHNYIVMCSVTEQLSKRPLIRNAQFLVRQEDTYYQYKAEHLFTNERSAQFELLQKELVPVINQQYIYVIVQSPQDNGYFILLRENAAVSGHDFLIKPYKQNDCRMVGGELYFHNQKPLLINNKSGSFQSSAAEATKVISHAFEFNSSVFHPAVEKNEVDAEIHRRTTALDDMNSATAQPTRLNRFFYQKFVTTEQPSLKPDQCCCIIM